MGNFKRADCFVFGGVQGKCAFENFSNDLKFQAIASIVLQCSSIQILSIFYQRNKIANLVYKIFFIFLTIFIYIIQIALAVNRAHCVFFPFHYKTHVKKRFVKNKNYIHYFSFIINLDLFATNRFQCLHSALCMGFVQYIYEHI